MGQERDELEAAHRAHLREMTEARREAERRRAMVHPRGLEERREADLAFRRERSPGDNPTDKQHAPRSRRVGPLG